MAKLNQTQIIPNNMVCSQWADCYVTHHKHRLHHYSQMLGKKWTSTARRRWNPYHQHTSLQIQLIAVAGQVDCWLHPSYFWPGYCWLLTVNSKYFDVHSTGFITNPGLLYWIALLVLDCHIIWDLYIVGWTVRIGWWCVWRCTRDSRLIAIIDEEWGVGT